MQVIVGVSFNKKGRIYNFDSNLISLKKNDEVIVETEKGLQYGFVMTKYEESNTDKYLPNLKKVIRIATEKDKETYKKNVNDSMIALKKATDIALELNLDMKFIEASYTFDRNQLLFNFISDDRVDFRELAKRLAKIYRTRIELRQIGVRDKAKEIGGLGPCGRLLCCNTFLKDLNSVTINMAKNQLLALNPTKINGSCGRLLCCLYYEDETYTELKKEMPEVGSYYDKNNISGKVTSIDIFKKTAEVTMNNGNKVEVDIK